MSNKISFEGLENFFESSLTPYVSANTIQILLLRQILDFTILRTEESRELNTVELPKSLSNWEREVYGLFLASKQKAVESRRYMEILRTYGEYDCYLPMNLCQKCPRCVLFGSVNPSRTKYNIKHRIEYSSAYSLYPFEDIHEIITFNAINEGDQSTHQALNLTHNIKPLTIFPSIITLKSVTYKEFVLFVKTLLSAHSYGAETRVKGDVRNEIVGFVGGLEEIITPLEFTMELREYFNEENQITLEEIIEGTSKILDKYKNLSSEPNKVSVLKGDIVASVIDKIRSINVDEQFVSEMQKQVDEFIKFALEAYK